jgi:hypothetical protein
VVARGDEGVGVGLQDLQVVRVEIARPPEQLPGGVGLPPDGLDAGGRDEQLLVGLVARGAHGRAVGPVGLADAAERVQRVAAAPQERRVVGRHVEAPVEREHRLLGPVKLEVGPSQPARERRVDAGAARRQRALQRLHLRLVVAPVAREVGREHPQGAVARGDLEGVLDGEPGQLGLVAVAVELGLPLEQLPPHAGHGDEGLEVLQVLGLVLDEPRERGLGVGLAVQRRERPHAVVPRDGVPRLELERQLEARQRALGHPALEEETPLAVERVEVVVVQQKRPLVRLDGMLVLA